VKIVDADDPGKGREELLPATGSIPGGGVEREVDRIPQQALRA